MTAQQFVRTYGRTRSRSLNDQIMVENANLYKIIPNSKLDKFSQTHLEIGFGNGENIIRRSDAMPNSLQIGIDVYKNGICKVLKHIQDSQKENICLSDSDARQFFEENKFLVDVVYIMFPDPWNKKSEKKKAKKRLFNSMFVHNILNFIRPGGFIVFASDHKDYYDDIKSYLSNHSHCQLEIIEETVNQHPTSFDSISDNYFVESNYEKKAVNDRWYGVMRK